jgi:hypothetical protein
MVSAQWWRNSVVGGMKTASLTQCVAIFSNDGSVVVTAMDGENAGSSSSDAI